MLKKLNAKRKMTNEMLKFTLKKWNMNKNQIYKNWKTGWDNYQLKINDYTSLNDAD